MYFQNYSSIIAERHALTSDKTDENIKKLLAFSKDGALKNISTQNIINHTNKTKRNYQPKSRDFLKNIKPPKKTAAESIFSEEDFEKFSTEYFLHSNPINRATVEKKRRNELKE